MSYNLSEKRARQKFVLACTHTEEMLRDSFDGYAKLIQEQTLEANLESARLNDPPDGSLEKMIGDKKKGAVRSGTKAEVVESKLDSADTRQNTSGDIPKLEEKRLSDKPVEKQKSEKAHD